MGWEKRGPHGPYLYRSVRIDGEVRKQYIGRGLAALVCECKLIEIAETRQREVQRLDAERVRLKPAEQLTETVSRLSETLLQAVRLDLER